jgi:sugar phosphate isomerase/epimerase
VDFVFMLTRDDRTVEDCLAVADEIAPLGLRHVGFKDIGVSSDTLRALVAALRAQGATVWMEVVSTTAEACLASAKVARDLGVDRLLGGTQVAEITALLAGSATRYLPFPGRPRGHPTALDGTPVEVEAHCRDFVARGCAGADLLAYRATESAPLDLVRAARRGLGDAPYLLIAGNVDSAQRIGDIAAAGADGFTIGSAAFAGRYSPRKGALRSQLADVIADCARLPERRAA